VKTAAVSLLGLVVLVLGCSAAPDLPPEEPSSPAGAETGQKRRLPRALEALELSAEQRERVDGMRVSLERDAAPLVEAGRNFGRALAGAARHCESNSPFIAMEAEVAVRVGEQVRGKVLDSINEFHSILTPAQRRKLSQHLLGVQEERRERPRDDSNARSLADEIDLSFTQTLSMLVRLQTLRASYDEKIEPWRERYESALVAFAKDRFDVRDHDIAQVPVVELATSMFRDGFRLFLPLLEEKQCEALGSYIDVALEKDDED
jgi:Spy/CpxP family protein refolding chaperone